MAWLANKAALLESGEPVFFIVGLPYAARQKVLDWNPRRLLIAHGEYAKTGATEIIRKALSWMYEMGLSVLADC